jgi:hypothetical protein
MESKRFIVVFLVLTPFCFFHEDTLDMSLVGRIWPNTFSNQSVHLLVELVMFLPIQDMGNLLVKMGF